MVRVLQGTRGLIEKQNGTVGVGVGVVEVVVVLVRVGLGMMFELIGGVHTEVRVVGGEHLLMSLNSRQVR